MHIWSQLLLGRHQPGTESERRYVRIGQAVVTGVLGKAIGLAVGLISVPLTIRYLGAERYGLWMVIGSMLAWLNIADLGLGNSLINALAQAYGKDDKPQAQRHVASVFWLLTAIAGLLALIGFAIIEFVDWASFFNVKSAVARAEVTPALRAAFLIFVLQFPLSIVQRVLTAHQELRIANAWAATGNLLSLPSLIIVVLLHGGLVALALAVSGTTTLCSCLCAVWLFTIHKPHLLPKPSMICRQSLRQLGNLSWMFFVLSLSSIFLYQCVSVIISHYQGPEEVIPYSVTWRLFATALLPQSIVFTALWPTITEALARRDRAWVKRTFSGAMKSTLLLNAAVSLGLILGGRFFIRHWAGPAAVPSLGLIILMAVWFTSNSVGGIIATLLNGAGHVRIQVIVAPPAALLSVLASALLAPKLGASGALLAMVLAYNGIALVPCLLRAFRLLNDSSARNEPALIQGGVSHP
ncbi:MAG: MATE family efflux transporter [Verrucomicrobia bacterium]|nr:MATE family efflux transporter [Verrucomicrobiota bacterium]